MPCEAGDEAGLGSGALQDSVCVCARPRTQMSATPGLVERCILKDVCKCVPTWVSLDEERHRGVARKAAPVI